MRIIDARNVNDALIKGVILLADNRCLVKMSRAGEVREWPEPVATVYKRPMEKVLWSSARAANPFFHFFEAMWMLNGGKDVEFVQRLLPRMAEYSDDGVIMQGAYGFRWREWFDFDQLDVIVKLLLRDLSTRRAVLQMWSPNDLLRIDSKDIPCNTAVYFKVRDRKLDMLVSNRSNDMLWGAYGANAVHMAFLLEYVSDKIGVPPGIYTQVSDSFHIYTTGPGGKVWARMMKDETYESDYYHTFLISGQNSPLPVTPMRAQEAGWDDDRRTFFELVECDDLADADSFVTFWWKHVATPLWRAFALRDASCLSMCKAPDWRVAGYRWFAQQESKEMTK